MRLIAGISLLLLGFGTLSCRMEGLAVTPPVAQSSPWVRTANGWERTDVWRIAPAAPPPIHPLVVAAGQGLLSVFALVAFQREEPLNPAAC